MKIKVRVNPNSGRSELERVSNEEYKASLKASPEDNKANIELIKLFKKELKQEIKIIRGFTSRNKVVEVNEKN